MRSPRQLLMWMLFSALAPTLARGGCADPNLSVPILEFRAQQTSRLNALLHFGEAHNLCIGVEYVDTTLLTNLTDIHVPAGTPVGEAIRLILGKERSFSVDVREGVIEIGPPKSEPPRENIFDYVLPVFEAKRASLQEASNLLHMDLVIALKPEITGFAGHYFSGDVTDQVGPFREYNRCLRSLLNAILAQSKGGAWISRIAWRLRGDFKIPERRRVWTFVQYGVPNTGYTGILTDIASDLENDADPGANASARGKPLTR